MAKCFCRHPPINISISKLTVSHHYGQKDTMSLWPVSPPPHLASTPANEAKVLWKQCGPLTEKDALCSAAEFQSEWISGAEVAYLITACCLGWKWTMVSVDLPSLSAYVLINSVKSSSKTVLHDKQCYYHQRDHDIHFFYCFNMFLDVYL